MAKSKTALKNEIREKFIKLIADALTANGEEVLTTATNEISMPVLDSEGNDEWVQVVVKIPTGDREANEPYDGYTKAEQYADHLKEKSAKAEKAKADKAKKIARDKADREARARAKAEAKARKEE